MPAKRWTPSCADTGDLRPPVILRSWNWWDLIVVAVGAAVEDRCSDAANGDCGDAAIPSTPRWTLDDWSCCHHRASSGGAANVAAAARHSS